jgi:site-specific recombinase XerD
VDVGFGDLAGLIPSFERSLRAQNKSPRTIQTYVDDARRLLAFLESAGMPTAVDRLTREHVEAFIADQLDKHKPSTAAVRFRSLQQLFKWLVEEREIASSPMANMKVPTVPEQPVPVIPDEDLRKLLKACDGAGFEERRDTALFRVMLETGVRLSELAGIKVDDVDFGLEVIAVTGKGGRGRAVPFGPKTGTALDRYLRMRARHPKAREPGLWLGPQGALTTSGITQILRRRCREAGIAQLHPHQFRHTAAHAWLAFGGTEGDAMRIFGWRSREMLARYGASRADERAREAFRKLLPGERV